MFPLSLADALHFAVETVCYTALSGNFLANNQSLNALS